MGKLLKKIGQCMAKHKWAAIIIWLVALLGFGTIVAKLGSNYNESLSISGIPSTEIQSTLKKEFHQDTDHGTLQVVIKTKDKKGLLQPKTEQAINSAVTKAKKKPHVASVTNPYQEQKFSKDLTTTYATVTYDQKTNSVTPATIHKTQQAFKTLDDQKGVEVEYTGTVSIHPMGVNEIAELGLLQPKTEQAINSAVTKAKKKPHVASVTNPYQEQKFSKDLTTTYATVTYDQKTNSVTPATIHKTQQAFKTLDDQKGVEVEYTGTVSIHPMGVNEIAELIGVAIAFVFMMVLFRSFITVPLSRLAYQSLVRLPAWHWVL